MLKEHAQISCQAESWHELILVYTSVLHFDPVVDIQCKHDWVQKHYLKADLKEVSSSNQVEVIHTEEVFAQANGCMILKLYLTGHSRSVSVSVFECIKSKLGQHVSQLKYWHKLCLHILLKHQVNVNKARVLDIKVYLWGNSGLILERDAQSNF